MRCAAASPSSRGTHSRRSRDEHRMAADPISAAAAMRAPASEPLRHFLHVARGAGLRVSAAEGIDAARAVDVVGYADRTLLKDTLGAVLAKTIDEKAIFDE